MMMITTIRISASAPPTAPPIRAGSLDRLPAPPASTHMSKVQIISMTLVFKRNKYLVRDDSHFTIENSEPQF